MLAGSESGYTVDFNMYLGKANRGPQQLPLSEAVVQQLMAPYLRQGYQLFIDNFYTSLPLLHSLYDDGTRCTGTLRANRGPPGPIRQPKPWAKRVSRGDMRYVRDGNIFVIQWMDKKPVRVASTLHCATDSDMCVRNSRDHTAHHVQIEVR